MANISKLKTGKADGPPTEAQAPANTKNPPRDKKEPTGRIEFSVPESVIPQFMERASQEFGFRKGAKSQLFLKIWEDYIRKSG